MARLDRKRLGRENKADRTMVYVERLEGKVDALALACQSLWELLRDNTKLSEDDLKTKMEEIDLRDGRLDGKLSKAVDTCSSCGRKTSRRRPVCLYCGITNDGVETFGTS